MYPVEIIFYLGGSIHAHMHKVYQNMHMHTKIHMAAQFLKNLQHTKILVCKIC